MCDELLAPVQPNVTAQGDTVPCVEVVLGGGAIDFAAMTNIYHTMPGGGNPKVGTHISNHPCA